MRRGIPSWLVPLWDSLLAIAAALWGLRRKFPWLPKALGYAVSAGCLIWVLSGYPLRELIPQIKSLDWKWVLIAVGADLSVYICHGWRWVVLLQPVAQLPFWRTVQAIYIGLFANEILPLRTGELIRCYLLAHWNDLRLSVAFASAAVERLIDGFWMLGAFVLTARLVKGVPRGLVDLVQILGGLLLVGAIVLLYVAFHKHHAHAMVRESRWAATLRHVVEGLHQMGNRRTFVRAVWISLLYLVAQIASVWALMRAAQFDLSIWVAAAVLTIVRFGTVIPNAPGNLGVFQFWCVIALGLFDVERIDAKTFSFVMFFALTLPLLIGGAVATALTGLKLEEIHHRARRGLQASQAVRLSPSHPDEPQS